MNVRNLICAGAKALLGCSLFFGCTTHPPPRDPAQIHVSLVPRDFRSSFGSGGRDTARSHQEWSGALAVFWRGSLDDQELRRQANETIGRGLYLVELSTGARVRGTVREGVVRLDGEVVPGWPDGEVLGVMSFVPTEPLDDGWYVLVADLREWMAMGPPVPTRLDDENNPVEDDMMFVRIRIGSEPTWYMSGVSCSTRRQGDRETWCDAWVVLSEEVDALGTTRFELRIDGEAASDCVQPSGPGGWQCPHYPVGTAFEISLIESDVVVPLEGVVTQALTGGGMSSQRPLIAPRFGIDVARSAR